MITLQRAKEIATEKGHVIKVKGYVKRTGRRVLYVTSFSNPGMNNPVVHTPNGFVCYNPNCREHQPKMCSHIGAVALYLEQLSNEEKRELLAPRQPQAKKPEVKVEEPKKVEEEKPVGSGIPSWMMKGHEHERYQNYRKLINERKSA